MPLLSKSFQDHRVRRIKFSRDAASILLRSLTKLFARTYVVIDGLDEIPEQERVKLLKVLAEPELQARILCFSRPHDSCVIYLPPDAVFSIEARNDDLRNFVLATVNDHPRLRANIEENPNVLEEVIQKVTETSQGMWVLLFPASSGHQFVLGSIGSWSQPFRLKPSSVVQHLQHSRRL